ncbi:hypothetical protein C8R45DRAFT_1100572 [Mycena sanguinolenta]|nr:hypothetical protein C8R45DRAFT_1100572 [Mycena sanguinolenta]
MLRKCVDPGFMCADIAAVHGHADRLRYLYNNKPSDAQIIVTFLMFLPTTYNALAVALDVRPNSGDLDVILGCLLNKEQRQEAEFSNVSTSLGTPYSSSTTLSANTNCVMSHITCFKCQECGHYQSQCPEPGPLVPLPPCDVTQANFAKTMYHF